MSADSWDSLAVSAAGLGPTELAEQVLSALPVAVCLTDSSGRLVHANARAVTRFRIDATIAAGVPLHAVLGHLTPSGQPCSDHDCVVHRGLRSGTTERFEREFFQTPDGSQVVFDWLSAPWTVPAGNAATVVMLRDVTVRATREDQLTQQQQIMDRAQRLARLGIWEYDIVQDRVVWSPQLYEIFGIPEGTGIDYATYMAGIHPDDRGVLTQYVRQAIETQKGYAVQHRVVRGDGEVRVVLGIGEIVRDGDGRPVKLVGTAQDVTERAEAERRAFQLAREKFSRERAEAERERLKRVFEQLPAIVSVTRGPDHLFEVTNERHREFAGRDVTGLRAREAFPPEFGAIVGTLDRVFSTGQSLEEREVAVRMPGARDTRYFNASYQPLAGADGRVEGVLSFAFDVTELVHATRALRDQHRLSLLSADVGIALTRSHTMRDVLQHCAEAVVRHLDAAFARVWTLSGDTQTLELRASAGMYTHIDGGHARVPLGRSKVGLIAAERIPHLTNAVVDDPRVDDREWARREGLVAFAGYPLIVEDEALGVLAMFTRHPLSEMDFAALGGVANALALGIHRKRLEEVRDRALTTIADERRRLQIINLELDQFAYVASHDLKAPLRGVANLAQWIEEDLQEALGESTREMLALLRSRMHRMEALIDGLLQFSRAGRMRQKPEPVDVAQLVHETIELLSPPESARILLPPELPTFTTEKLALQQVFLNLLSNALKYTQRADAQIRIAVGDEGDEFVFTVADNGPGIPAEFHDKIWGIFQTLHSRDRVEGTGIGLALVKKIVESRGGVAFVTSAEGQGAAFSFTWPKHTPDSEE
jgi:PAS domain S-box-containing protein